MTRMRAKLKLSMVQRHEGAEVLTFAAVAANKYPADGSDENNTYAKFSPTVDLKMHVCNPALFGKFNPGETYYVDFTPVE